MTLTPQQRALVPWKRALVQAEVRRRSAVETCALLAEAWAEDKGPGDAADAAHAIAQLIRDLGDDPDETLRAS